MPLIALWVLALGATAHAQSGPRGVAARLQPLPNLVPAIAGRPLLLPVEPYGRDADDPPEPWIPSGSHTVRLGSGVRLDAQPFFLSAAYPAPAPGDWLAPAGAWRARSLAEITASLRDAQTDTPPTAGFWALLIQLPDTARGQRILLDGAPIPVAWLDPPPERLDTARSPVPDAPFEIRRALGERLRPRLSDPNERWRVRLLTDRLRATALFGRFPPPERLDHPALEAFARQREERWRAAIDRVARDNPDVADRLALALTAVTLMPDGSLLPTWTLDASGAGRVRTEILRPSVSPARAASLAESWLASLEPAAAWIIDDAGDPTRDSAGRRVAIAELTGRRTICSAAPEGQPSRNASPLPGHESAVLQVGLRDGPAPNVLTLTARAGQWSTSLLTLGRPLPASPPGVALGPLLAPWNLATWRAGEPVPLRDAPAAALLTPASERDRWQVYLECVTPPGPSPGPDTVPDYARLWLGPYREPRAVLRVSPDGTVFDEIAGRPRRPATVLPAEPGVWRAIVELPPTALEPDGTVLVGVERLDARGVRAAWPRPLLPRQEEPGRARIDTTTWNGLTEETDAAR